MYKVIRFYFRDSRRRTGKRETLAAFHFSIFVCRAGKSTKGATPGKWCSMRSRTTPLIATWNRCFAPYLERRARCRRFMRRQYTESARRGKGNRAWKRAEALSRSTDVLCWPEYLQ